MFLVLQYAISLEKNEGCKMNSLSKKNTVTLMILCAIAYFTSYLTRVNFAAVIAAIVQAGDIDKPTAGIVTTLGFITYGVGQLVSGWLGDRINPKKLMFGGFLLTAAMNLLIPICPDGKWMCIVWAVNGFAQSFMWPPMVKIIKTAFDNDRYNNGILSANIGGTSATILIYLVAPYIINRWNWHTVFRITGGFAVVLSVVWVTALTRIEKSEGITYALVGGKSKDKGKKKTQSVNAVLLLFVMLAIMLQGALRDGVTTWVPTFITEVFHLDSSKSILTSVVIPLFSCAILQVTAVIFNKMGKRPYFNAVVFFALATVCAIILRVCIGVSPILTVLLSALLVGIMHGINLILVCYLPAILARNDNMSSISGALNFTTYVGSAISTFGFAVFSENTGWSSTVALWAVISALGVIMCLICGRISKR